MINTKTTLLGCALGVALSAPAMAADFQALADLQGPAPTPLTDVVLAATEGGAICDGPAQTADTTGGGVALCASLPPFAHFSVANEAPVTAAQFLQVHGLVPPTGP